MVDSPCKNCADRKIPKTCEEDCARWQEYKMLNKEEKVKILNEKKLKCEIEKGLRRRTWV